MPYANPESLVSTAWLAQHLQAPDLRLPDVTVPEANRALVKPHAAQLAEWLALAAFGL